MYIKREAVYEKCGWYNTVNGKSIYAVRKDEIASIPPVKIADNLEQYFIDGAKECDNPLEILNWYRNLYYKEEANTERRLVAEAINALFTWYRIENLRGIRHEDLC